VPELAFGYLIGFAATTFLVALHIFLQVRKQQSVKMRFIQKNLRKNDLFWSDCESTIKTYSVQAEKDDLEKSLKSIMISGAAFVFMSWAGFILQLILMLSIRFLAVKRLERNLFESELATKDLTREQVVTISNQLMES
jgi:hypothetical protein